MALYVRTCGGWRNEPQSPSAAPASHMPRPRRASQGLKELRKAQEVLKSLGVRTFEDAFNRFYEVVDGFQ